MLLWGLLALGLAGMLLHAAWIAGLGRGELNLLINHWVYNGVLIVAAIACLVRAAGAQGDRIAWLAFGLGLALWTAGDIYWTIALAGVKHAPYPSWADALYLAAYPCLYVGVLAFVGRRVRFVATDWLDGAIAGLAAAALASAVLAPALLAATKGDPAVVATNLAYPLADVLLLSFLIAGVVLSGARIGRGWILIGLGLATWAVADGVYLYQSATSVYDGGYLDSLWLIGGLLIAGASLTSAEAEVGEPEARSIFLPSAFAFVALGVLAWDNLEQVGGVAVWLAVATLAMLAIRLAVSFRENAALLRAVKAEAVSDALTGLANRRSVMSDLGRALAPGGREWIFALFDLDGFKAYNDTFGHPAGDLLLRRMGANLAVAVGRDGVAYRLGGDEFCVLVPGGDSRVAAVLAAARAGLCEEGEGFSIGASAGVALLPAEAADPAAALRLADTRMYAEKGLRPNSARRQTHQALVRILREREPALSAHLTGVARLAVRMGKLLELGAEDLDALARAAELHDVGKIAIPDRIVHKRGDLDDVEWDLMRSHTLIGERILGAAPAMAPVAKLVRSSHERWDGDGYPDGLAGEEIPLGARIIFICDAFEAMTSDRAYRSAMPADEALAELRRCAGTQFDPMLVDVFAGSVFPSLNGSAGAEETLQMVDQLDL